MNNSSARFGILRNRGFGADVLNMDFLAVIYEKNREFGRIYNFLYLIFSIVSVQTAFEIEAMGLIDNQCLVSVFCHIVKTSAAGKKIVYECAFITARQFGGIYLPGGSLLLSKK